MAARRLRPSGCPAAAAQPARARGAGALRLARRAGSGDRLHRRLPAGHRGPSARHRRVWISELGIHYKLGIDGLNVFLVGLTTLLFAAATLATNLRKSARPDTRAGRAPAALLLPLHARRVGRARRVPGAGPGPVRGVLRPDADPVLLPDRRLGPRTGSREGDDQARDLHARGLAADARGRDRHGRARGAAGRRAHHVRALLAAAHAAQPTARRSGSSCSSPPRSS